MTSELDDTEAVILRIAQESVEVAAREFEEEMRAEEAAKLKAIRGTHMGIILAEEARKRRRKHLW